MLTLKNPEGWNLRIKKWNEIASLKPIRKSLFFSLFCGLLMIGHTLATDPRPWTDIWVHKSKWSVRPIHSNWGILAFSKELGSSFGAVFDLMHELRAIWPINISVFLLANLTLWWSSMHCLWKCCSLNALALVDLRFRKRCEINCTDPENKWHSIHS